VKCFAGLHAYFYFWAPGRVFHSNLFAVLRLRSANGKRIPPSLPARAGVAPGAYFYSLSFRSVTFLKNCSVGANIINKK
jgi:hypothetical protein